jgi:DNA-binding NtrC family response regulator
MRMTLAQVFSNAGYTVLSAADGEEAISTSTGKEIDVALIDIKLPKVSGIEVLKHLHREHPSVRSIVITGYADLKYAMEAKEYGALEFMNKPFALEDLLATVERVRAT